MLATLFSFSSRKVIHSISKKIPQIKRGWSWFFFSKRKNRKEKKSKKKKKVKSKKSKKNISVQ
jgi:hypothetical protein